jgi:UDP-glucose 4-epimerase
MSVIGDKTVFITGGAGFIGSALAARLIEHNNRVIVYDNFARDSIRHSPCLEHRNVKLVRGDVMDLECLRRESRGADVIIHAAAITGIDTVMNNAVHTMRTNVIGTANVLEIASQLDRCDRFVLFSTSEVFGERAFHSQESDLAVTGAVGEARWTYAVSKLAGEHMAHAYYQERGLPVTVLRPFNVYGPGQVGEGAMRIFIERALENAQIEIHGEGTQIRAWCYVDDVVEGTLRAMSHPKAVGESFNVGNQRAVVTIYGLANTVVRVLNSASPIVFTEKHYADVELRIPSVTKARELLDFEARVDLEEGIRRTARSYGSRSRLRPNDS